jgi:hypothetical protein
MKSEALPSTRNPSSVIFGSEHIFTTFILGLEAKFGLGPTAMVGAFP